MTKNIKVTDMHGISIGTTYPKRAKGLVKNGRAEYIGSCEIRMIAHAPIANDTEDKIMSKVINFNAREFKFDKSCENNVGSRLIITDCIGNDTEVYEIGNWGWDWTQIVCEKQLEKNADYVFRFAMTGGYNDTDDAVSQFTICPVGSGEELSEAWENRFVYPLDRSRFKPTLSKYDGYEMLKVYEIPFNTGDCESFMFYFTAMHAVARFFPAVELEAYASLQDVTYDEFRSILLKKKFNKNFFNPFDNNFSGNFMPMFEKQTNEANMNFAEAYMNFTNTNMSEKEFAESLKYCGDGCNVQLKNVNVSSSDNEDYFDVGEQSDGNCFDLTNATLTSRALSMLLCKLGDGCNVQLKNVKIISSDNEDYFDIGGQSDGNCFDLANAALSSRALSMLLCKLGDGCCVNSVNVSVTKEGIDNMYGPGNSADGLCIDFSNSRIPKRAVALIKSKLGDGCNLNLSGADIYED